MPLTPVLRCEFELERNGSYILKLNPRAVKRDSHAHAGFSKVTLHAGTADTHLFQRHNSLSSEPVVSHFDDPTVIWSLRRLDSGRYCGDSNCRQAYAKCKA